MQRWGSAPLAERERQTRGLLLSQFDGRCLKGVDSRSKGVPEFVVINEQPNDESVHALRLGEVQRATHEPFEPAPQVDVLALDFLCMLLAHLMLSDSEMPLIGPPPIRVKSRDAKRCQQLLELQEDVVLSCRRPNTYAKTCPVW